MCLSLSDRDKELCDKQWNSGIDGSKVERGNRMLRSLSIQEHPGTEMCLCLCASTRGYDVCVCTGLRPEGVFLISVLKLYHQTFTSRMKKIK